MTEHADQLRTAFESHEHLAPDATEVYVRAQELARTYRRRRIGAQTAGVGVLGVGLVAGGLNLPTLLHGGKAQTAVVQAAAGGGTPKPATTPPTGAELDKDLEAYFAAGYSLEHAKQLAKLWNMSAEPSDLTAVKAEAGRQLLAGQTLPVKGDPAAVQDPKELAALDAFFAAGYSYVDAEKLAELWKSADPYEAKVTAGQALLDGKKLPIKPDPSAAAVDAFFAAGYDYDDAVALAKLWKSADPGEAKVAAGKRLLAGKKLPIKPSPEGIEDAKNAAAYDAFFKAGYDYADAEKLAKLWKTASPSDAKVMAGEKLLAGKKLPIKP